MKKIVFSFIVLFLCFNTARAKNEGDYYTNPAYKSNGSNNGNGNINSNGNGSNNTGNGGGNAYGHDKNNQPMGSLPVGDGTIFLLFCSAVLVAYKKVK